MSSFQDDKDIEFSHLLLFSSTLVSPWHNLFTHSRFDNQFSVACLSDLSRYLNLSRAYYPAKWTRRNDDGKRLPDSAITDDELIVLAPCPLLSSSVASPEERQYDQHIPIPEVVEYQHTSVAETVKSIGILKCKSISRDTGNSYKFNLTSTSTFIPNSLREMIST